MLKSCSRCGRIHETNYVCTHNKPKVNWSKYNDREYNKLINTNKWHKKSEQIRQDSRYLCAVCEDEGVYNYRDIEVHHITKVNEDKNKLLDNYNLIALCHNHHKLADAGMIDKEYLLRLAKEREDK